MLLLTNNYLQQQKMYNLLRTTLRCSPNLTLKAVRPLSTAANPQPQVAETDKLFKTVELELRGNDPAVLKSFCKFATTAGNYLDVKSKAWNLRKPVHERYTVLKSVHIYKKHRVQYEHRTYFTFIQYKHLTGSTADTLLEYVERNLPEGVALKATKIELQGLPGHLNEDDDKSEGST